ncbi:MAG: hypothetical protein WAV74_09685, partial [Anaerolineae bacterium]
HTFNHKEHREHKETADQTQIGNFSAFFVISVVKNQGTFGIPGPKPNPKTLRVDRPTLGGGNDTQQGARLADAHPASV